MNKGSQTALSSLSRCVASFAGWILNLGAEGAWRAPQYRICIQGAAPGLQLLSFKLLYSLAASLGPIPPSHPPTYPSFRW